MGGCPPTRGQRPSGAPRADEGCPRTRWIGLGASVSRWLQPFAAGLGLPRVDSVFQTDWGLGPIPALRDFVSSWLNRIGWVTSVLPNSVLARPGLYSYS